MIATWQIILAVGFFIVAMSWVQALGRKGRTTGRVVEFVTVYIVRSPTRKPRIVFKVNDIEYSFLPSVTVLGDEEAMKIGTEVPIAYNIQNPKEADLPHPGRTFFPPAILTLAYILYIVFLVVQA